MGLTDYTISDKKYFESGRKYERELIVKLLESQTHDLLFGEHDTLACCLCSHLRLIKGEQK